MENTPVQLRARFEAVVREHGDDVLRAAMMQLSNRADAEDVLQETFLRYATSAPRFVSKEHEKAWLLRVAINLAKDMRKTVWNQKTMQLIPEQCGCIPFKEKTTDVYDAVMTLPEKYRMVVHLFYYEGYSVREISDLTGLREPTIKTQLSRGRALLKDILEGAESYAF